MTLVYCAIVPAFVGIAFSLVAYFALRHGKRAASERAMNASKQLLLFAMLCLAVQYAWHCWRVQ